jgi:zinc protease
MVMPNPTADIVAARLFVRAGSLRDPRDRWGVSHLLSSVITRGTLTRSAQAIAEQVETLGANFGADSAPDYSVFSFKTVGEDFEPILALAAEIMRSPSFPDTELALERRLTLQSIQTRQEQPFSLALGQLRAALYGDHPYAQLGPGPAESVAHLTRAHLQTYYEQHFRPEGTVLSIAGNLSPEMALALAERYFGDWQGLGAPVPTASDLSVLPPDRQPLTLEMESQQTILMLGYPAVDTFHPDYPVLKVLMTYLCNGMSSKLFVELRERQGLAYEVSGFFPTRLAPSHLVVYLGTTPSNTAIALAQLQQQMTQLAAGEFTAEDLAIAQRKLLGQYALGKQTNSQLAHLLGWYEILRLGWSYDDRFQQQVATITLPQAQEVAAKYFHQPIYSLVGPASQISAILN